MGPTKPFLNEPVIVITYATKGLTKARGVFANFLPGAPLMHVQQSLEKVEPVERNDNKPRQGNTKVYVTLLCGTKE